MKSINLNSLIKVKLTPKGVDIFYHQNDELNKRIKEYGGKQLEPRMPKIDSEGYTEFQLWDFMHIYGEHMKMGLDTVIKPLNIYIKDEDVINESNI